MTLLNSTSVTATGLPEAWRSLFWDCDFDQLDWQQHREFLIRRILVEGDWDAVCWIRRTLGDPVLREWISRHQGDSLSPQQLRFWELILDLPAGLVSTWLQSEERRIWEGRMRK